MSSLTVRNENVIIVADNDPKYSCMEIVFKKKMEGSFWKRLRMASKLSRDFTIAFAFNFSSDEEVEKFISVLRKRMVKKHFKVEKAFPEAIMPTKSHLSDVGWDLYTPIDFSLLPGEVKRIDFGIIIEILPGYEIQVRNRSGVVWKYNVMMALGQGTIDTDYRGHIMAPFYNFGTEQINFSRGDRLAQMVIKKVYDIELKEGKVNTNTKRGTKGFGSTGL